MPRSSPAFDAPLVIDPAPSRALAVLLVLAHGAAATGLLAIPLPWALAGGTVLAAALAHDIIRLRRRTVLRWETDGSWRIVAAGNAPAGTLVLSPSTCATRGLVVLVLRDTNGRRWRTVIARDSLHPVTWRRLLARLRVRGPACTGNDPGWHAPGADA